MLMTASQLTLKSSQDGSGQISFDELSKALTVMGYQLTDMEVKELIVDVDYDHSGQIGFDEFS